MNKLLCLALALSACGGPPKAPRKPPSLEDSIRRATSPAVVTFALFTPKAVDDPEGYSADATKAASKQAGMPLSVTALPVGELPLDVAALAASAGDYGATIQAAGGAVFVRYLGGPKPEGAHIRATARAIAGLGEGVLVDLSTTTARSPEAWAAWLASADFMATQVIPRAERAGEAVLFFSQGMAKFALPDVELESTPAAARGDFERFQRFLATLRARGKASAGETVEGVKLRKCARERHRYDRTCVRM